jgi:hypothetical protein
MLFDADAIHRHAGLQEKPDDAQQAFAANVPGQAGHRDAVVYLAEGHHRS